MTVRVSTAEEPTRWHDIEGDYGSFRLEIRKPTLEEREAEGDLNGTALVVYRMPFINGWHGIKDEDGKEIPFNLKTFGVVVMNCPEIYRDIINALVLEFTGLRLGKFRKKPNDTTTLGVLATKPQTTKESDSTTTE